jgi:hypothetical protein
MQFAGTAPRPGDRPLPPPPPPGESGGVLRGAAKLARRFLS